MGRHLIHRIEIGDASLGLSLRTVVVRGAVWVRLGQVLGYSSIAGQGHTIHTLNFGY